MLEKFKSTTDRLARMFKESRDKWKAKADNRQKRLRAAEVKIRDLQASRDRWKQRALEAEKSKSEKTSSVVPKSDSKEIMDSSESAPFSVVDASPRVANHVYSAGVIVCSIMTYVQGWSSSRGIGQILEMLGLSKQMSQTTILDWVYRWGLFVLQSLPERRDDWIYVIDHTIALGNEKCLVILGITVEQLNQVGYSPCHQDMQVLGVEITSSSTGSWVAERLERVAEKTGYPVQIVSDHGSDLCKGIELFKENAPECVATYDVTHRLAVALKHELAEDQEWIGWISRCDSVRQSLQQTALQFLVCPRTRSKARFMGYHRHLSWAEDMLDYYDRGDFRLIHVGYRLSMAMWVMLVHYWGQPRVEALRQQVNKTYEDREAFEKMLKEHCDLPLEDYDAWFWENGDLGREKFLEHFQWLIDSRETIVVYGEIMDGVTSIQTTLKKKGLHTGSPDEIRKDLPKMQSMRAQKFVDRQIEAITQDAKAVSAGQTWLASSDIIESVFGKYKTFTQRSPVNVVGKLVLAIPAFIGKVTVPLVKAAMETVSNSDVRAWFAEHLNMSRLTARHRAFHPSGQDTNSV